MIVELVGLPGSGKTTFAKRLAADADWKLISIDGRGELLFYNVLFLFCHPLNFIYGLGWLCHYRGLRELWYTKFVNLFLVHNAKYMKAQKYPRAIIDQGHQQNIISLFDTRVEDNIIDRYVRCLPKPDLLCFFLANEDTRTKRLSQRGYGAREELREDEREAWEEAREAHFEHCYLSRDTLSYSTETVTPEDEEQKREKIKHARPWYFILHGRMPTEKAHGLQIAKTMEALQKKGVYATLWIPRRKNPITLSVGEYYDVRAIFPTRTFAAPNFLYLPSLFGQLRFWLDAFGFFLALVFTRIDREGVYYTRNPELAWLLKLKGASTWYEAHVFPSSKAWLLKFFLAHVDGIIANSMGTKTAFMSHGFPNVYVVRNGVDVERFTNIPQREEARTLLGLPEEKRIIMYVGAFYEWKGVPFLFETWQKHFGERNDLLLVLVGGSEKDLRHDGSFADYHHGSNVLFVPHTSAEKIPLYLSAADVLVLPNVPASEESIRYTSPIKLFEYMASGRPIIAADLPSIREVLSKETALLFAAGNSEALASSIEHVFSFSDEARQLSAQARKTVHEYTWERRAQLLLNIIRSEPRNRVSTHAQFLKTITISGFGAIYYLLLVYLLTDYFSFLYSVSVAIAYICVLVINFFLLKRVFVGGGRKISHEFSRYALLVLLNFVLNELATYVLVEYLYLWYMLAQVLIVVTLAIMNFFAYRSHIFRRHIV